MQGLAAYLGLHLWRVPSWYLDGVPKTEIPAAISAYRTALGPIFVGLLQALGGAAIVVTLFLAWRQLVLYQRQQTTERLKNAIEKLESEHGSTRLAAVYEFEDVARESPVLFPRVLEILQVYIRDRTTDYEPSGVVGDRYLSVDVRIALSVMTRLEKSLDPTDTMSVLRLPLDLAGSDLRGITVGRWAMDARLDYANLTGATITVPLNAASKWQVDFTGARFISVSLHSDYSGCVFRGARFETCWAAFGNFRNADFEGAVFEKCSLQYGDFTGAKLKGARFNRGVFEPDSVDGVDMEGVIFSDVSLRPRSVKGARNVPENVKFDSGSML